MSIDAPDLRPDYMAEDLSVNDIESLAELVLEDWLDIEDAFPEADEPDEPDTTPSWKKDVKLINQCIVPDIESLAYSINTVIPLLQQLVAAPMPGAKGKLIEPPESIA